MPTQQGTPVLVVLGIDPEQHEIPALLKHHLVKMQKDFNIAFLAKDDIGSDTVATLQDMLKQAKFEPTAKKQVATAKTPISLESGSTHITTNTEFCPRCQNNVSVSRIETQTSITKTCQSCGTMLSSQGKI